MQGALAWGHACLASVCAAQQRDAAANPRAPWVRAVRECCSCCQILVSSSCAELRILGVQPHQHEADDPPPPRHAAGTVGGAHAVLLNAEQRHGCDPPLPGDPGLGTSKMAASAAHKMMRTFFAPGRSRAAPPLPALPPDSQPSGALREHGHLHPRSAEGGMKVVARYVRLDCQMEVGRGGGRGKQRAEEPPNTPRLLTMTM